MMTSDLKLDISIIMPVFNEEEIIGSAILETFRTLKTSGYSFEIIAVNDGSNDSSLKELQKLEEFAKIESYYPNKGKGYALKYGSKKARGERIVFYDSDLNIDPVYILKFLKYSIENGIDIVIGSKRVEGSKSSVPLLRKSLSTLYHLFSKALFDIGIKDSQVGLKLITHSCLEEILQNLTIDRYAYDVELLLLSRLNGYKIQELPINLRIEQENSGINFKVVKRMFIDTLRVYFHHSKSKTLKKFKPKIELIKKKYFDTK